MNALIRVLRAFVTAMRMTVRGEKPPQSPYAPLLAWMQQTVTLTDSAFAAAAAAGLDQTARRKLTMTAEGRRTNMETVLAAVKFHAAEEYKHLLTTPTPTVIGAIYGTNLNDRFLLSKLFDILEAESARAAVGRLMSHLESIPPTTS